MNEGRCVLTYNWGDSFTAQKGSAIDGLLGVAPTPGSPFVYDRETKELARCDKKLCGKYGVYDKDFGWINQAPYAAFGGWSGAVSSSTSEAMALETANFYSFMSNIPESIKADEQAPYRESQLNVSAYEELGYPRNGILQYFETVSKNLESENVVMDIRFPGAREINGVYNEEVTKYLEQISEGDISTTPESVVNSITEEWNEIIKYDSNLISEYQQSLNFKPPEISSLPTGNATYSSGSKDNLVIITAIICIFLMM